MAGRIRAGRQLTARSVIGACLLGFVPLACADGRPSARAPIEVVDDAGDTVRLAAPAQRIASLIPGQTDIILALGAADRLIVRTEWDTDGRIADVPSVGNALTPSVEWLAAQQPDLIIAWTDEQSRSAVSRLRGLGIPVAAARVQTIADLERVIRRIGTLLGLDDRADALVNEIRVDLDAARGAVAGLPRPAVLYLIGLDPPMAAGPGTYIDELIEIAGGRNAFADAAARWPTVSMEEVVTRQPDHLVMATSGPPGTILERLRSRPGWRDVPAVREGRVHQVDVGLFNRPGPGVGAAALRLARLLHPQPGGPRP